MKYFYLTILLLIFLFLIFYFFKKDSINHLKDLGFSVENINKIIDEKRKLFPQQRIYLIDSDYIFWMGKNKKTSDFSYQYLLIDKSGKIVGSIQNTIGGERRSALEEKSAIKEIIDKVKILSEDKIEIPGHSVKLIFLINNK